MKTYFLIFLIIMIPITASSALASIGGVKVIDKNDKDGYVKRGEPIYISASPFIENDDQITPDQIRLGGRTDSRCSSYEGKLCPYSKGIPFGGCSPSSCEYTFSDSLATSNWPNPFTFKFYLYKDDETLDSQTSTTIYFDELSPVIDQLIIPSKIGREDIRINYTVTDRACSTCGNKCSGLDKIQFSSNDQIIEIISLTTDPNDCNRKGFIDLSSALFGDEGTQEIITTVFDNFGNNFSMSKNVYVDRSSPYVDMSTFKILWQDKEAIVVPPYEIDLEFRVNISDKDLASVELDLDSFGLGNKTASCANLGNNTHQCSVFTKATLTESKSHTITVKAIDSSSNLASVVQSTRVGVDTFNPTVVQLKTNHVNSEGQSFLSTYDNILTAVINDGSDSVGFKLAQVYIDLSQVNSGRTSVKADNCTLVSPNYECYWYDIQPDTADGMKTVTLLSKSKDDATNSFTEYTASIKVDRSHPVISEITYSPAAPTSADALSLNFKVNSGSEVSGFVNGSEISADSFPKPVSCSGTGPYDCSVSITGLTSDHKTGSIFIQMNDAAGNIAVAAKTVEVFKGDYNSTPSFFRVNSVTPVPASIDKKVASQIDITVFVGINLQNIGGSAVIADMDVTCNTEYLNAEPTIINEFSTNPYISLRMNSLISGVDNVPINCNLSMSVRDTTTVYGNREIRDVSTTISMYGNALGDIDENMLAKIESISAEIEDVQGEIDDWDDWVTIGGAICNIASSMGQLNSVIQNAKSTIYLLKTAWSTVTQGTIAGADEGVFTCVNSVCAASYGASSTMIGNANLGVPACVAACGALQAEISAGVQAGAAEAGADTPLVAEATHDTLGLAVTAWAKGCIGMGGEACDVPSSLAFADAKAWVAAVESWAATCEMGNSMHEITENYLWASTLLPQINNIIGYLIKLSCSIFYHCALCDLDAIGGLIFSSAVSFSGVGGSLTSYFNQAGNQHRISSLSGIDGSADLGGTARTFTDKTEIKGTINDAYTNAGYNSDEQWNNFKSNAGWSVNENRMETTVSNSKTDTKDTKVKKDKSIKGRTETATSGDNTITSKVYKGTYGEEFGQWTDIGETTEILSPPDALKYDPYKSIHFAEKCYCIPAISYNLEKDKQIKCMYRNCIENMVQAGISTSICDTAYRERECLYVEGAIVKEYGYMEDILSDLMDWLWSNLPYLLAGLVYQAACAPYIMTGGHEQCVEASVIGISKSGWWPVSCGLIGTALTVMQLESIWDSEFGFNNAPELDGEDYCASGGF